MLRNSPQSAPTRFLGPRALAVLSCALALLAAKPLAAAAPRPTTAPVPSIQLLPAESAPLAPETEILTTPASTRKIRAASPTNFFSSARRLHILATVEILHRLLLAELRPVERQLISAFFFEPQTLCSLEQPLLTLRHVAADPPPGLPRDRAFAIEHCLLAPPVL